ncbi:hypothetical protein J3492_05415 [Psychrobacter sp. F1192]|uniref:Uncharacterized protein n=1 Tax=Psychrobacter coccoides TaxID=2818440 RepID=A0ABS3NMR2_9GAMM|nr:hypothetical protein [Psychrobacter coccoides]
MIDPFANNHQSMQIGELVIENQEDKIIIYGDIDLYLNQSGYEQAKQLHELTSKIIEVFEDPNKKTKKSLSSKEKNDQSDIVIDNPFL